MAARSQYAVGMLELRRDAAQRKLDAAVLLLFAVLAVVTAVLLIGIKSYPPARNAAQDDIPDQFISPESSRMIVQRSQTILALVIAALLFFFAYLRFVYPSSFEVSSEERPSGAQSEPTTAATSNHGGSPKKTHSTKGAVT
ncbi:MAG TPA: hypothetical protein VHS78_09170 [Candidatus Elarobacter sp.]|nr:hypothetical protein [Candidatus Elarobacter sp.]